jgi:regulator of RNase E activity RraB
MQTQRWNFFFVNVNDRLASIALDLSLRGQAPMTSKAQLLWVWVYLRSPKPDGLSDKVEFETLAAIEDDLSTGLGTACLAIEAGRITTAGRREFYFYGADDRGLRDAVFAVMRKFEGYQFETGSKADPQWRQYLDVLYPSDEDFQRMRNMDVLNALIAAGDTLQPVRDVRHWLYFRAAADRQWFTDKVGAIGYNVVGETEGSNDGRTFGLIIARDQSVTPDQIDATVIELFRLAREVDAAYDGWEAEVVAASSE